MHRPLRYVTLVSLLGVLAPAGASAPARPAQPDTRETWYVLMDGDLAWGTTRVRRATLRDGRVSYITESRILTTLFGTPQEMTGHGRVIVGPNLEPLHIEAEMAQRSGTVRVGGEARDGVLEVTIYQGGEATTSTFSLSDGPGLIADVAIEEWLHGLPEATTEARVRLFHSAAGSVGEVAVELVDRSADGEVWRIEPGAVPGEYTIRLDAEGVALEQLHRFPPLRIVRHPDASELELVHRPFDESELLVHAVDRPLPPLGRIAEMSVRVSWRGIEPEAFNLEDNRQSLGSLTTEDGLTTAVVALRRPAAAGVDRGLPIGDDRHAQYLGESDFIEPDHPEIVRTAREIVGDAASARVAAEAICAWTAAAIEPVMIAETLSGPDVLERRIGKCTEYATLYASLARAAGIPTRIVLGQRLFPADTGMQWGGHMWNEVWLGEWVAVDASAAEFGGSPALLKFVHSAGVVGTQDLRWRLTESLAISVLDVATIPLPDGVAGDPDLVDGVHAGVWTSVERAIRFRLPTEGWRVETVGPQDTAILLRLRPPEPDDAGDSAMIHFSAFDLGAGIPPRSVSHARLNHHRANLQSLELLHDEGLTVDGAAGHRIDFRGVPKDAPPLRVTELVWSRDGSGCLLNLITSEELHERWGPTIDQIAETFEYLRK